MGILSNLVEPYKNVTNTGWKRQRWTHVTQTLPCTLNTYIRTERCGGLDINTRLHMFNSAFNKQNKWRQIRHKLASDYDTARLILLLQKYARWDYRPWRHNTIISYGNSFWAKYRTHFAHRAVDPEFCIRPLFIKSFRCPFHYIPPNAKWSRRQNQWRFEKLVQTLSTSGYWDAMSGIMTNSLHRRSSQTIRNLKFSWILKQNV